jgi:hypothetical protein
MFWGRKYPPRSAKIFRYHKGSWNFSATFAAKI